jgi:hypothetical protein
MKRIYSFFITLILAFAISNDAFAHCDHIDGPVVNDARVAIEYNDITPLLKWINKEDEAELASVFEKTMRVRQAGGETQEIADRLFFETLVRLHRASEGAPYTGLKPAGTPVAEYVTLSDNALEYGFPDELIDHLQGAIEHSISEKFNATYFNKRRVNENVEYGRAYVHSYVDFVHYVKHVLEVIKGDGSPVHDNH